MNRIILIGNGFDLAHGLKTRFKDFTNDYWQELLLKLKAIPHGRSFDNNELTIRQVPSRHLHNTTIALPSKVLKDFDSELHIKNQFFWNILKKSHIELWVDIEQEFYNELKRIINNRHSDPLLHSEAQKYTIDDLNSDFNNTILLLNKYLAKIEEEFKSINPRIKSRINKIFYCPTELKNLSIQSKEQIASQEYELMKDILLQVRNNYEHRNKIIGKKGEIIDQILTAEDPKKSLKEHMFSEKGKVHFNFDPNSTLLLNFNYTQTHTFYDKPDQNSLIQEKRPNVDSIQIHGSIYPDDDNPIIFGFGDELDGYFKSIEDLNDNKFLEFIKSIKYSNRSNYKKLLEFIESDFYHVFIMGHSCGISDRTLLNTIFEHNNCTFIKPYYHQWTEENGLLKDNYSEIVRNISRNFNSKTKMRDRVVNYEYCEPLIKT